MSLGLSNTGIVYAGAAAASGSWSSISNAIGAPNSTNAVYAATGDSTGSWLYLSNYNIAGTDPNIADYTAGFFYIEVTPRISLSGVGTGIEKFGIGLTLNGSTVITPIKYFCADVNFTVTRTIPFYFRSDGSRLLRKNINGNTSFGVILYPVVGDSYSNAVQFDSVGVRAYYLDSVYAKGERSVFPYTRDNIPAVINAPTIVTPTVSSTYIVKARQMNLLSDAVHSTEATLLAESDVVGGLGPGLVYIGVTAVPTGVSANMIFVSTTVTGILGSLNQTIYYNRLHHIGGGYNTSNFSTNLTSVKHSLVISLPPSGSASAPLKKINFNYVSGIGWADQNGSIQPIYVDPRVYVAEGQSATQRGVFFGFTAIGKDIFSSTTPKTSTNHLPLATVSPAATGKITVKIFALGTMEE
jgi:hypothetical protein